MYGDIILVRYTRATFIKRLPAIRSPLSTSSLAPPYTQRTGSVVKLDSILAHFLEKSRSLPKELADRMLAGLMDMDKNGDGFVDSEEIFSTSIALVKQIHEAEEEQKRMKDEQLRLEQEKYEAFEGESLLGEIIPSRHSASATPTNSTPPVFRGHQGEARKKELEEVRARLCHCCSLPFFWHDGLVFCLCQVGSRCYHPGDGRCYGPHPQPCPRHP